MLLTVPGIMNKKLRLQRETVRSLTDREMEGAAGGHNPKPYPSISCLDCSAYPYICITNKPTGCPILP